MNPINAIKVFIVFENLSLNDIIFEVITGKVVSAKTLCKDLT